MAIHWQVKFKTLRGGKVLTASVYDNTYDGQPIQLKGGAEPFTTEEDNDDDPFKAIRTQTGSLRIVDDGYALDGVTPFNWRDLQPRSDHDRPVILTDENDTILWQGFLQAQNFSGTLYEATQEREFPLQCALSVLSSQYPNTTDQGIVNFAYLLNYVVAMVAAASLTVVTFTEIIIQGGADAQRWLSKKFHWANLLSEDSEEELSPQYDLLTCLTDMCNFWGFQARTEGSRLYLMCQDDPSVQTLLTLSPADLATLATGTVAGTVSDDPFIRKKLTGDIFASNDNDDMWVSGPSEVTVNAECNEQSTAFQFAPKVVEDMMEAAGNYTWHKDVDADNDQIGFFSTPLIHSFNSKTMSGTSNGVCGFARRQMYSSEESDKPTNCDMFVFTGMREQTTVKISVQTKRKMSFSKGSLKFSGSVYYPDQAQQWDHGDDIDFIVAKVGIGDTYESARWWYFKVNSQYQTDYGWTTNKASAEANMTIGNGDIKGIGCLVSVGGSIPLPVWVPFEKIPVDEYMHGYIFVDFYGVTYKIIHTDKQGFQIGNFKVEFSRDEVHIPANIFDDPRPREVFKDRVSSKDYKTTNENAVSNKQNIDLVYASDNNMKYGFGLVMEPTFDYMQGARYGDLVLQHPEQHFAERITAYWNASRRLLTTDLRTEAVEQQEPITPRSHLIVGPLHYRTLAISHQWRDDVTTVKMIQSLILLNDEEE